MNRAAVAFLLLSGCAPCGEYEGNMPDAASVYGDPPGPHFHAKETCGTTGTFGTYDRLDGIVTISLWSEPRSYAWIGIVENVDWTITVPAEFFVPDAGEVPILDGLAEFESLAGSYDPANLASGTLEVLGEGRSTSQDFVNFRIHWDLVFGDPEGDEESPWYTTHGTDWIGVAPEQE